MEARALDRSSRRTLCLGAQSGASRGLNTIQIYQWPADTETGFASIKLVNGQKYGPVTGY